MQFSRLCPLLLNCPKLEAGTFPSLWQARKCSLRGLPSCFSGVACHSLVQALWHLEITVVGSAQWASGDTMNTWARSGYQVNEYGAERVHRPDNTENFH
jgi:hypothetical protein